jgi:hypothetical protein
VNCFVTGENEDSQPQIPVNMSVLNEFAGDKRGLLIRHLATSAKWKLIKERGGIYAYRRAVVGGRWVGGSNGYYSSYEFNDLSSDASFQYRIILSPDGPAMDDPWRSKATYAKATDPDTKIKITEDKEYKQGIESYLVVKSNQAAIEIFEQSGRPTRRFTALALRKVEQELKSLLASTSAAKNGFDLSLMPDISVKMGKPEFHMAKGMQGGMYGVLAYVNPGEQGRCYVKVFEATTNTPLSADRTTGSSEYIGWSNNPEQKFLYQSGLTVYEGDWGDDFKPKRCCRWPQCEREHCGYWRC